MRVRPAFVTGSASMVAFAAVVTVVLATTPADAGPGLIRLLWTAVFLTLWGSMATLLLLVCRPMAQAMWIGLWLAAGGVAALLSLRYGLLSRGLLIGVVLATLGLSVITWRTLRRVSVGD